MLLLLLSCFLRPKCTPWENPEVDAAIEAQLLERTGVAYSVASVQRPMGSKSVPCRTSMHTVFFAVHPDHPGQDVMGDVQMGTPWSVRDFAHRSSVWQRDLVPVAQGRIEELGVVDAVRLYTATRDLDLPEATPAWEGIGAHIGILEVEVSTDSSKLIPGDAGRRAWLRGLCESLSGSGVDDFSILTVVDGEETKERC